MNPVAKVRKDRGISVTQLAILAGVSAATIRAIEKGDPIKISPHVLRALERLGYDPEQLAYAYADWRHEQIAKVLRWAEKGA